VLRSRVRRFGRVFIITSKSGGEEEEYSRRLLGPMVMCRSCKEVSFAAHEGEIINLSICTIGMVRVVIGVLLFSRAESTVLVMNVDISAGPSAE